MAEKLNNKSEMLIDKLQHLQNSYLDLLQSCLTGIIYRDRSQAPFGTNKFDLHTREHGLDWPARAQTMIGTKRMANLRALTESVIADNVPGDLIETGVWRGGACIFMRAILYAHNITDRCVWAADSFEGLPVANELQYPADAGSDFHTYEELAASFEQVQENFRAYGLLDEQTKFLKGWFKDTLPSAPVEQLALIRLDGDMYESTMDALTNLYPKLSHLGYVIIDDYCVVPACKAAVHDYCNANGIQPEIIEIDGVGVYWRKFDAARYNNISVDMCQTIMQPEMQIARLNEAFVELSRNVMANLEQSLTDREGDIDRLNQSLTDREGDIDRLNQSLTDREGDIDRLNQLLTDREGDIDRLNQLLTDREGDIDRLNQLLTELYSSTSWRLTKPIRSIKNVFNGSRKNYAEVHPQNNRSNYQMTCETSSELIWQDDLHLKINDVNFYLSIDTAELQAGNSNNNSFLLGKPRHMVEKSFAIGQQQKISKIFEMGILQGGSVVLYDQIFQPEKIVAIEYVPKPVDVLTSYIIKHSKSDTVKPYYGTNQADRSAMETILSAEFPDRDIDLIIDDASHLYDETREAFNISFPYLKNGGLYIIEDWAWAHWSGDYWQKDNAYFNGRKALSNLLIELFMLAASKPDYIKDVYIEHCQIIVRRGTEALPEGEFDIASHYLLRGKSFGAWL